MSNVFIPDYGFDAVIKIGLATQEDVNKFINTVANDYNGKWEPVSGGYTVHVEDEPTAIELSNTLSDLIDNWVDTL